MESYAHNGLELESRAVENYQPKRFNERHFSILRLLAMGLKVKEVAHLVGVTNPVVQYTRDSPQGQDILEAYRAEVDLAAVDVAKELQGLTPAALTVIADTMVNGVKPEHRLQAARDIMDRAGYGAANISSVTNNFITQTDLDTMKQRAFSNPPPEMVEDAEVVETLEDSNGNVSQ